MSEDFPFSGGGVLMTTVEVSDLVGSLMSPGMSIERYVAVQELKGLQNRWKNVEYSCCKDCMSLHRSVYIVPPIFSMRPNEWLIAPR
jgi:hypothetical protein